MSKQLVEAMTVASNKIIDWNPLPTLFWTAFKMRPKGKFGSFYFHPSLSNELC